MLAYGIPFDHFQERVAERLPKRKLVPVGIDVIQYSLPWRRPVGAAIHIG